MRHFCFLLLLLVSSVSCGQEIDPKSGLTIAPGYELVKVQCTVCHSASLITQNRGDRTAWLAMIRWMQETQGLWPLGDNEVVILDYLATHYAPVNTGRRAPLAAGLMPPPS